MEFSEKYTSMTDKEPMKKIISDDTYALGEMLQELKNKIEHLRLSMI